MKESIIIMSFSALLLAPSGILSQPTSQISTIATYGIGNTPSSAFSPDTTAAATNNKSLLILAKVNDINDELNQRLSGIVSNETKIRSNETEIKTTLDDAEKDTATDATTKNFTDEEITQLRQLFLQAESALKKKNEASYLQLTDQLKDYPLYPYLRYQWLKKHLGQKDKVKQFLQQNSSSRYARILNRKWLHYLGKRKQWSLLLENQTATKDATLNCYYQRALLQVGDKQAALIGAAKLWAVGHSQPRACDPLFTQLKKSDLFTQDLRWQRFDAALNNNKVSLASYVMNKMPKKYHARAQLWMKLHRAPSRYLPQLLKLPQSEQSALMFRHAIDRLARKDITAAIEIWDANKQQFNLSEADSDKLERRLAMKLVYKDEPGAYDRLVQLNKQDNSSRAWRVRVALSEQNWPNVLSAILALDDIEKARDKWQYWLARAYMETGEITKGHILLSELSEKRSFYGFLAADKVNSVYQLADAPVDVSEDDITELKNRKEFRVAFEFMMLDRKNEAKLQWWHASHTLNKNEILVAAKLAQQWQWDEIAIFTIAKAKYWDDIEVRFPLNYVDKIHENSVQHNLNPVILYGLIRRESAFNEKAHSPTGARGLMQIMPRTGKYIARHLNERWRGSNSLYNPVTNIKYGSYYYQKLLTQFDGHYAIALAAYNAGPSRVKRWLPESKSLPADIWIETIPYKETREYVINVLAYALIYQQRTQADDASLNGAAMNTLSMNDFTRDISPLLSVP